MNGCPFIQNTKSLVEIKKQMLKDELLETNRKERSQTHNELKQQQDNDAIVNIKRFQTPLMLEHEDSTNSKQKKQGGRLGGRLQTNE